MIPLLVFAACKTSILRKQISGVVYNGINRQPLSRAALKTFEGDTLSLTDSTGHFLIPEVTEKVAPVPGQEKGALAPNSDKIVVCRSGFKNDTIFIYQPNYRTDAHAISIDTVYLEPLP